MHLRHAVRYGLLGILAVLAAMAAHSRLFRDQSESVRLTRSLIASLHSRDPLERRDAAVELGAMRLRGEGGSEAVPALIDRLDDRDQEVRQQAAESLLYFQEDAAPAVPALARILRDGPADLRGPAVRILDAVRSEEADRILVQTLADPDPELRLEMVATLGARGRAAAPHVPRLIEVLDNDPDVRVRESALHRLVEIDPRSKEVEKAKLLAMRDRSAAIRKAAVHYLARNRTVDAMPFVEAFRIALRDLDQGVRNEAIQGLGRVGLHHPSATDALCKELGNPKTRDAARKAIAHIFCRPDRSGDPSLTAAVVPLVSARIVDVGKTEHCGSPPEGLEKPLAGAE